MLQLEDLKQFTYSLDEVNEWLAATECNLEVKRSEDGTHLEVWDSSGWMDWEGPDEDFKPVLFKRLYPGDHCSEEWLLRSLVKGTAAVMVLVWDLLKGEHTPERMIPELWYALCSFTKPEAALEMVYRSKTGPIDFYEREFYVLSNFSAFRLAWLGVDFDTSEHAYHWAKFSGTKNERTHQSEILHARSAHEAFKYAEAHKAERRHNWDEIKADVMTQICRAKAEQHEYVRRKLLQSGDRVLVEGSWRDSYWGIGPDKQGENMLGRIWMQIRNELQGGAR